MAMLDMNYLKYIYLLISLSLSTAVSATEGDSLVSSLRFKPRLECRCVEYTEGDSLISSLRSKPCLEYRSVEHTEGDSLASSLRSKPCLECRGVERTEGDSTTSSLRLKGYLERQGIETTRGNRLVLLPTGQEKFDDLFAQIHKAKHHIHMEYFNFRNDSISYLLFDHLIARARAGVEVRILFDAFGNTSNDSPLKNSKLDELRAEGIQIHKFDPIVFPWVNHIWARDHRKIVVLDGAIAYTGGMNIADYYIKGKPELGQWRDIHCRLEGPVVHHLQGIFADMWHRVTGERIPMQEVYYPTPSPDTLAHGVEIAVVDRQPHRSPRTLRHAYAEAIAQADSLVRIVNPYFVPTGTITRAIRSALARGVRVEIMVSSRSDIPVTPQAMLHKLRQLAKLGACVYLYGDGFHHSKVLIVDETFGSIGSLNLNSRSLRYDYETNIFFFDPKTSDELIAIFERDKAKCVPLDDTFWSERSAGKKFVGWLASLLTPFL